jgi:curli biogenesis system outer membrane secretion channel CsgG
MAKNKALMLCASLLLAVAPVFARAAKPERPRVCVLEFPVVQGAYDGWHGWGYGGGRASISGALQDLFTTELITAADGRIRLIERENIEKIVGEQKFSNSGLVDEKTAVDMGKILGVRYMITGKVTRFAYKKSGFGTGWGVSALVSKVAPSMGGAGAAAAGSVHVSKASFSGRLDVRLIDVKTSEILAAMSDEGTVKDTSVKVAGTGNDVQYDQELVNQIFEPAVKTLSKKLLDKIAVIMARQEDEKSE